MWDWNWTVHLFGICEISRFQHVKRYFNTELQAVNPVFPNPFSKEEHVKQFFISWGQPTYESRHNITLNMKWPKENREAVAMAWKELQYSQLLDRISCDSSRVMWKFLQYLRILIYLFQEFRIPNDVLENSGWGMLS